MRREGFELGISRPRVLYREDESGARTEPYETVAIAVDDEHSGTVVEKMQLRKAQLTAIRPTGGGQTRTPLRRPSRCPHAYPSQLLSHNPPPALRPPFVENTPPSTYTMQ